MLSSDVARLRVLGREEDKREEEAMDGRDLTELVRCGDSEDHVGFEWGKRVPVMMGRS